MIEFDAARCKIPPFPYQVQDIRSVLQHPFFGLFLEMGCGKSAITVNSACVLADTGEIENIIVACPASVMGVWKDPTYGEVLKHHWLPCAVYEFRGTIKQIWADENPRFRFIVCNYELLRQDRHLKTLSGFVKDSRNMLVCDESSFLKNRTSQQFKAMQKLRKLCERCIILTGTPITHSPIDLFSQMKILSPEILGDNFWVFRSEYCELVPKRFGRGRTFQLVAGFKNLNKLTAKCAPYVTRRLKADVLSDLPPKLYTIREVAMTPESWKRYQELKRDAVASLPSGDTQLEPNCAVRVMRLAQLTSGHLGGAEMATIDLSTERISSTRFLVQTPDRALDLSSEKLDWCVQYFEQESTARYLLIWSRWRRERERLAEKLIAKGHCVYQLYGGQPKKEREQAIAEFSLRKDEGRKVLIAQPHCAGFGLNLVAAEEAVFLSNDWSLGIRLQAIDRNHRPGQVNKVLYTDVLATGPEGQPSIDSIIYKALSAKEDLSKMTTAAWRKELEQ